MLRGSRYDRHGGSDPLGVAAAAGPEGRRANRVNGANGANGAGRINGANGSAAPARKAAGKAVTTPGSKASASKANGSPAKSGAIAAPTVSQPRAALIRGVRGPAETVTRAAQTVGQSLAHHGAATTRRAQAGLTQGLANSRLTPARVADKLGGPASAGARHAGHPDPAMPEERTVRENFPVALRILPAHHRRSLAAVYRYARLVDDIGDEAPPEARGRLLDLVDRDLDAIYAGQLPELPALQAIREFVREHAVPEEPLRKLVRANRQDQEILRYETWDQLVEYCTLSADPVGHLVLHAFDSATPERIALSDRICTALQVVEHCQDVAEDFARGRVYLPAEDLRVFGCTDADLAAATTPTRLRGAVTRSADRAAALLDEGEPLVRGLDGWAGICVAGYLAGGRATLAALRAGAYDVHARRLRPSRVRTLGEALLVLGGK